jgi:rhodanese-related sulfurtransferase
MSVTPHELIASIDADRAPVILDVRSDAEYRAGHVPGALHIPFTDVRARAESIPGGKDETLVVYCGHGPRAWIAGATLKRLGFGKIEYLKGHMRAWRSARLRQETG